jgi:hypothetical protein
LIFINAAVILFATFFRSSETGCLRGFFLENPLASSPLSDRLFHALPFVYLAGGVLAMVALRSSLAVFSGLLLMAVAGIDRPRPPCDASTTVPAALIDALKARFGERCSTALAVREQHGRDESAFTTVPPPAAVVFAESTQDVADAVKLASEHEVPVIPTVWARRSKATCWRCRAASASTWAA